MPDATDSLFQIPDHLDPTDAGDRAKIILRTSATLSALLAKHLCNLCPPDRGDIDAGVATALIGAQIRCFLIYLAVTRYSGEEQEGSWAESVSMQLQDDYPPMWQADLAPFMGQFEALEQHQREKIEALFSDPFGPYRGSTLTATEKDLMNSPFGRLLRLVIPALYAEESQATAGQQLLDLTAKGARAFLADVCGA